MLSENRMVSTHSWGNSIVSTVRCLPVVFADKRAKENKEQEEKEAQLYQQIGQLKVELDWLKKKAGLTP